MMTTIRNPFSMNGPVAAVRSEPQRRLPRAFPQPRHVKRAVFALIGCLVAFGGWLPITGEELTDEQAIESADKALSGRARFPWYDSEKKSIRPLDMEKSKKLADSANRKSKWAKEGTTASNPRATTAGRASLLGGLLQVGGLTLLIALLGVLAFLIAKAFLKHEVTESAVSRVIETSRDVDRVEALPFHLRKSTGDFLAEARRLYEAGNYSEAIVYLFSYQLVELDKHHVLRLAKGKTNRQYLRETRQRPILREILDQTMVAFEDVFFGHHTLPRDRFEACWQRLDDFHRELAQLERAAA